MNRNGTITIKNAYMKKTTSKTNKNNWSPWCTVVQLHLISVRANNSTVSREVHRCPSFSGKITVCLSICCFVISIHPKNVHTILSSCMFWALQYSSVTALYHYQLGSVLTIIIYFLVFLIYHDGTMVASNSIRLTINVYTHLTNYKLFKELV